MLLTSTSPFALCLISGASCVLLGVSAVGGAPQRNSEREKPFAVITDMWFDDLGALSILKAGGVLPDSITTATGMMGAQFWTANYTDILDAWHVQVPIYESNISCSSSHCQQPFWGKENARKCGGGVGSCTQMMTDVYDHVVKPHTHSHKSFGPPAWGSLCPAGAGCTILSIGTLTELNHAIKELSSSPGSVDRVIVQGAFFGESREGLLMTIEDPQSAVNLAYPESMDPVGIAKQGIETNYYADPNADVSFVAHLPEDVELILVPHPVSGMCRIGMQTLLNSGKKVTNEAQLEITVRKAKGLCDIIGFPESAKPLHDAACLYVPGSNVLLDADAITSTYLKRPDLFKVEKQWVSFNGTSGQTLGRCVRLPDGVASTGGSLRPCVCPGDAGQVRSCAHASVATDFDSIGWYGYLESLLRAETPLQRDATHAANGSIEVGSIV